MPKSFCSLSGSALSAEETAQRLSAYAMAPVNACERHPEWTPYQIRKHLFAGYKKDYGSLGCDSGLQIKNINFVGANAVVPVSQLAAGALESQQLQSYRHR